MKMEGIFWTFSCAMVSFSCSKFLFELINTHLKEPSISGRFYFFFSSILDKRIHRVMMVSNLANILTFMVRASAILSLSFLKDCCMYFQLGKVNLFMSSFHQK